MTKEKADKVVIWWTGFCQLLGLTIGGLLIYAEGHHASSLYPFFTNLGFHLK
jgi:hypothetical protein